MWHIPLLWSLAELQPLEFIKYNLRYHCQIENWCWNHRQTKHGWMHLFHMKFYTIIYSSNVPPHLTIWHSLEGKRCSFPASHIARAWSINNPPWWSRHDYHSVVQRREDSQSKARLVCNDIDVFAQLVYFYSTESLQTPVKGRTCIGIQEGLLTNMLLPIV